jgi:uncharacterized protein YaaR (DUF327 family)
MSNEQLGYKTRIRSGFSTNAKGKAQLDLTVEVIDEKDTVLAEDLLRQTVQSVKKILEEENISLAE